MRRFTALSLAIVALAMSTSVAVAEPDAVDGPAAATATARRLNNQTPTGPPPEPPQPPTATYNVVVFSDWSEASHPATLPPNSHVSPPVVAVHGVGGDMFAAGSLASPGVERMAETGSVGVLRNELAADPTVAGFQVGPRSIFRIGSQTFTFTVTQDAALVSVVTMLAPSPDWFIGVDAIPLFVDGRWVESAGSDLHPYDAGTDSGSTFTAPTDIDTNPAQVISGPRDGAFATAAAEGRFGHVVIERAG